MDRLMENWYLLLRTDKYIDAEILRGLLEENQVPVVVVNKQDSSYIFLGEIEVYVPPQSKELARDLMSGAITN
jgi:Putative prokaryotic signal transducing protein